MRYLFLLIILTSLLVCGCKQPKPTTNPPSANVEYVLTNKQISVTGIGESRNQQQARNKSRTIALDSASAILRESIQSIAAERGFQIDSTSDFRFNNTVETFHRTTAFNNDKGVRIYRHTQTLSIEVEPPLRDIFEKIGAGTDYSWDMFLRDVDQQLEIIKNKR